MDERTKNAFNEIWLFYKTHIKLKSGSLEEWNTILKEGGAIALKYNDLPVISEILVAIVNDIERRNK